MIYLPGQKCWINLDHVAAVFDKTHLQIEPRIEVYFADDEPVVVSKSEDWPILKAVLDEIVDGGL